MLKLGRVTKFKMLFLVLVFVFNFDLFKFSAAILEKGLFVGFEKFTSSYLFQIAREKSFDYLLIIYVWIYENRAKEL